MRCGNAVIAAHVEKPWITLRRVTHTFSTIALKTPEEFLTITLITPPKLLVEWYMVLELLTLPQRPLPLGIGRKEKKNEESLLDILLLMWKLLTKSGLF